MKRKVLIVLLSLVVLIGIAATQFDFPYYIRTKGVILPVEEWVLYRGAGGSLLHVHENHTNGMVHEFGTAEFQRGDIGKYAFNEALLGKGFVRKGDTLAWVYTSDVYLQIISLEGELAYNKSLLDVYLSGEKPENITLAENQVDMARQELETQRLLTARNETLFKQDVISRQEFELIENDLKVKEFAVVIAQSHLNSLQSGRKTEEIQLIKSKIEALSTQLEQLNIHIGAFHLISPVSGQVIRERHFIPEFGDEVVLRIADFSSMMVSLPIDYYEEPYVIKGQQVHITSATGFLEATGEVLTIDNTVTVVGNRPKIFLRVQVDSPPTDKVLRNMMVDARIYCGHVSMVEYLKRISRTSYQN
jgi:hypothetical protein